MERNCFAISAETQLARGTRPLWFSFIAIAALGCGTGDTGPASASGSSGGTSGGDASGCSAGELVTLATNQHPNSLATDATNVYWTNADNGDVMTVAKSGGAPTVVASREGYGADVAADDVNVYWSVHGSGGSPIFATPKAGGTTKQLATSGYLTGLAIDQERVYWSDSSGHMMSVPKTGG